VTSCTKPDGELWGTCWSGFLSVRAIRTRSVTRHPFAGSRNPHARHRRLNCGKTRRPQNSESGITANCLPSRGSVGSGGNLITTVTRCDPSLPVGFTRMSLAGYSLTGWSPPEPVSASPARKRCTWIDLHASKTQASHGLKPRVCFGRTCRMPDPQLRDRQPVYGPLPGWLGCYRRQRLSPFGTAP
jgi:hypothetical protein